MIYASAYASKKAHTLCKEDAARLEQLVHAVVENFSMADLQRRCQMSLRRSFRDLRAQGGITNGHHRTGRHGFKDNGANVLAVAHLDTVQTSSRFNRVAFDDETIVYCPKLDDRLGVYTILDLLPKLGVKVDVLLTENEEIGQSTACDFETSKHYNWIVEFDRCGSDAVSYEYAWNEVLREYFDTGCGSFSDICYLDHLECKAMNVGVAYENEHNKRAYFILEDYLVQVARWLLFYEKYETVRFPHTYSATAHYPYYGSCTEGFGESNDVPDYQDTGDKDIAWCSECHEDKQEPDTVVRGNSRLCVECGTEVFEYYSPKELEARK